MRSRRLGRTSLLAALAAGIYAAALQHLPAPAQTAPPSNGGYIDPARCAACHRGIWETYRQTGMGRSFYRPSASNIVTGSYYHKASDSYFTVFERNGKYFQRRHQVGPGGREINVMEKQIDFVLGSGNHARTYLHRTARNTLLELPLGWYAEKGGYLAMNPGYDRPDHEGFRRKIAYECMFCHNGYPKVPPGHNMPFAEPVYQDPLPEGIDCQRCHGPGRRHAQLATAAGTPVEDIRKSIVNPSRLNPERREEVCIQCHLEATSFPLPNSIQRYGRGPFDYQPGEPLSAAWIFFDHAPGSGREDKFEIVNAVYRIRKSKCFLESNGQLSCTSCHNPHDAPRGARAEQHYDAACRRCHAAAFNRTIAAGKHVAAAGCAGCHMPKRRTEDVVHSIATDHYIQRNLPPGDLLAERAERHETGASAYRGEVVLYYPPQLPPSAENELYLALAQVIDKSNLGGGIPRLAKALARHPNARAEFHLSLAEALQHNGELAKALPYYREAARRNPNSAFILQKLGSALRLSQRYAEAAEILQRAAALAATNAAVWHEFGLARHAQGKTREAIAAIEKAATLEPEMPEIQSNLGIILLAAGEKTRAEAAFREAIRLQPDYAGAHNNLANLLAGSRDFAQARYHFETALRFQPGDARTRYNFAMALGRARLFDEARQQLEESLRADPNFADAHQVLADMLMAKEQAKAAIPHYQEAVRLVPRSGRAHLGLGSALAMSGDLAAALSHLQIAAASDDASARQAAAELLKQLGSVRRP
jgi:predicted CXXCH cytochrome family protein